MKTIDECPYCERQIEIELGFHGIKLSRLKMRSGIYIRVGKLSLDIVDTCIVDFKKWWDSLNEDAKLRTVRHLLMLMSSY